MQASFKYSFNAKGIRLKKNQTTILRSTSFILLKSIMHHIRQKKSIVSIIINQKLRRTIS